MEYKHLFFDLDDTFWDVRSNQEAAQRELFATFGMADHYPDFDTYYRTFREINQKLWTEYRDGIVSRETLRNQRFVRLLESAGIHDEPLAMDMSNEYLRISPTFNALMPHSKEVLDYLYDKGYAMSLITNGFNEVQFHKVEYSGLKKYFQRGRGIARRVHHDRRRRLHGHLRSFDGGHAIRFCQPVRHGARPASPLRSAQFAGAERYFLEV